MNEHLPNLLKSLKIPLQMIKNSCANSNHTIAVAESVTSGCLQLLLSNAEGAQQFFQGGITVYNCSQKAIHLNIEPIFAQDCNGVDPIVAVQMAHQVCALFRSQIGIAITGYATKVPEENIDKLYAFLAIVKDGELLLDEKIETQQEGIAAQWNYSADIIHKLSSILSVEAPQPDN